MSCKIHTDNHTQTLRGNQLKATPARLGLLDLFVHAKKPLSVKDLEGLANKKGSVDRVTLYRNVEQLEKLGLIRKIHLQGREALYETIESDHHHHMVCKSCGIVKDVDSCGVEKFEIALLKATGFASVLDHSLEFFGLCKSCAKK